MKVKHKNQRLWGSMTRKFVLDSLAKRPHTTPTPLPTPPPGNPGSVLRKIYIAAHDHENKMK